MRQLSLAHLTFLDLPPPALIHLAAEAGFTSVGLRLIAVTDTTPGYPLMGDAAMMRETLNAMQATGVVVNDIEFVRLTPEFDPHAFEPFLASGEALGAKHIVTAPYDPDLERLTDNLSAFSDIAKPHKLSPVLEFFPWTNVPDFTGALDIVEKTGNPSIGVLLDTLHFDRSSSDPGDIAKAGTERLPFIHLCDALTAPPYSEADLLHVARAARMIPGHGQIPLRQILSRLREDIPIALEIPMEDRPQGMDAATLARHMVVETQRFLDEL